MRDGKIREETRPDDRIPTAETRRFQQTIGLQSGPLDLEPLY
jgi:hypothetical protein